jgi:hypothetical protein
VFIGVHPWLNSSPSALIRLKLAGPILALWTFRADLFKQKNLFQSHEPFSKPGRCQRNEAQTFRKSEPPHVGCYGFERASHA